VSDTHKGATRRYWCPLFLDEHGKIKKRPNAALSEPPEVAATGGCDTKLVRDGQVIPKCGDHGLVMKKARFKIAQERRFEVEERARLVVNGVSYWSDEAVRKSKCRLCHGTIERGERRIAIDARLPRVRPTFAGGVITSTRAYLHAACFIDMVFGGEAGEGCPGCSAKILHDEFMQVRDLLVKEYQ
jgi:hypothetical protein